MSEFFVIDDSIVDGLSSCSGSLGQRGLVAIRCLDLLKARTAEPVVERNMFGFLFSHWSQDNSLESLIIGRRSTVVWLRLISTRPRVHTLRFFHLLSRKALIDAELTDLNCWQSWLWSTPRLAEQLELLFHVYPVLDILLHLIIDNDAFFPLCDRDCALFYME